MTEAAICGFIQYTTSGKKKSMDQLILGALQYFGPLTDHQLTEELSKIRFGVDIRKISGHTSRLFYEGKLDRNEMYKPEDRKDFASQYRLPEVPVSVVEICRRNIRLKQEQLENSSKALAEWEQKLHIELQRIS